MSEYVHDILETNMSKFCSRELLKPRTVGHVSISDNLTVLG